MLINMDIDKFYHIAENCWLAIKTWKIWAENTNQDIVLKHLSGNRWDVELFLGRHVS
jgi:hypothetical protein